MCGGPGCFHASTSTRGSRSFSVASVGTTTSSCDLSPASQQAVVDDVASHIVQLCSVSSSHEAFLCVLSLYVKMGPPGSQCSVWLLTSLLLTKSSLYHKEFQPYVNAVSLCHCLCRTGLLPDRCEMHLTGEKRTTVRAASSPLPAADDARV